MKKKILFIGNGINDIDNNYKWDDLIDNLIEYVDGKSVIIRNREKPFPLLYEEIFVRAIEVGMTESELKQFIANDVNKLPTTNIHKKIMNLNIDEIITTNYDFTLENALDDHFRELTNDGIVKEKLYSIFRHFNTNNKRIWHIHGDSNNPRSINLGYEHYSGYLQQMRNYIVTTGVNYANFRKRPLLNRLKYNRVKNVDSWLDHFFLNDVYIFGLTLDFIEIDLWWLLTIRRRADIWKYISMNNKVIYFYPEKYQNLITHKIQLLKSANVIPIPCKYNSNNKLLYYHEVLEKIDSEKNN